MKVLRFSGEAAFREHRRTARRSEEAAFTAFVLPSVDGKWCFAVVASKARIGGAVERNRAKRRLRAAFATACEDVKNPLAVILYSKKAALTADFAELVKTLIAALGKS